MFSFVSMKIRPLLNAHRDSMEIYPGEKVQVLQYENRIELIPMRKIKEMRGFLKGIDTTIKREKDRV